MTLEANQQTQDTQGGSPLPQGSDQSGAGAKAADAPAAISKPEGLPEDFWDAKSGLKSDDLVKRFVELDAAEKARTSKLPPKAEDYKLEIDPAVFEGVKGFDPSTFEFDAADPALSEFRSLAHKLGVGQDQFSAIMSFYAKREMATQAETQAYMAKQKEALGKDADARIAAVHQFVVAAVGEDLAKDLPPLISARQIEAFEKLQKFASTQGATAPAAGKGGGNPSQMSEEEYSKLSEIQRFELARTLGKKAA